MIETIRALVRPIVTLTGWLTLLVLIIVMVLRFATIELAQAAFSFFTGALSVLIAWWFKERTDKRNGESPKPPVPPTP